MRTKIVALVVLALFTAILAGTGAHADSCLSLGGPWPHVEIPIQCVI